MILISRQELPSHRPSAHPNARHARMVSGRTRKIVVRSTYKVRPSRCTCSSDKVHSCALHLPTSPRSASGYLKGNATTCP